VTSSTTPSACGGFRTSGARRRSSLAARSRPRISRGWRRASHRFFHDAAPAPESGAIEAIRDHVTENFAQVEPFVGRFVSRDTFDAVRSWQLGVLEREPGRFGARVEQGRIRDGTATFGSSMSTSRPRTRSSSTASSSTRDSVTGMRLPTWRSWPWS
jgi:hypothetical protein